MIYLWIAIGSALGGMGRYWCSGIIKQYIGETFPWDTLIINILGSFIIGVFAAMTDPDGRLMANSEIKQFIMIGFCGGYTTFSSFSLQTFHLLKNGEALQAGYNIILSVILCMIFVWAGYTLGILLNQIKKI